VGALVLVRGGYIGQLHVLQLSKVAVRLSKVAVERNGGAPSVGGWADERAAFEVVWLAGW
jgi:hypothetical protein